METGGKRAESALDRVKREARETETTVNQASNRMGSSVSAFGVKAARALGAAAASYVTFQAAAQSVNLARDFNAALAETSTLIGGTDAEMSGLSASARQLAKDFGGSATSQVEGFYQAISAGAGSVEQAATLLESANKLAIGGATDTTTAVDALTTATNAYAASGLTAAAASDALFVGIKAGKTTAAELSAGLGNIVPIASAVGVSFDEVVAATAALTTQGQSTSVAITGLRQVISGVIKPTSEAEKMAAKLGLSFDAQALKSKGLAGFLEDVIDKTGGSQEAMAELFGSVEALNAVLAFAGGAGEKFAAINEQMADKAGATDEAYRKMADSLDQRWARATAAMTDIALGLGNVLLTFVVPALEAVSRLALAVSSSFSVLGGYITSLTDTFRSISTAELAQSALETAIDNTSIAMGDQINASNYLRDALENGNSMSLETIRLELDKARARRADVDAMVAQRIELAMQGAAYQDILGDMQTARDALRSIGAGDTDALEDAELYLISVLNRQKEFLTDLRSGQALRKDEAAALAQIEANIAELEKRQKALTGEIDTTITFTDRLANAAGGVSFSGAAASAHELADALGIALSTALQLSQTTPAMADEDLLMSQPVIPDAGQRETNRGAVLNFRRLTAPPRSGRGGGGGSAGATAANETAEAFDNLMASLDPVIRATQEFEEAQETINKALESGHATVGEAARAYDLAREKFDEASASARDASDMWGEFEKAGGSAIDKLIDGTGSLTDVVGDLIKELVVAYSKAKLLASVEGGSSSDSLGTLIFKGLFGGLFDSGGTIGQGQTGIVGEKGPELVKSTPLGAVVTSRQDTARRLDGRNSAQNVRVDVGVTVDDEGKIKAYVKSVGGQAAQEGASQAIQHIKTNWGNYTSQHQTDGSLS
jgi:TP901 family phage tail tape measure protein